MEPVRNSTICVLGMHRSGTSCLAGCLEERGLYLGDVANASANNPKGNKENKRIWVLNEEVLAASGGAWDRPPPRLTWNDTLRQRRDKIIASYRSRDIWGFKDPRTIITLPFWREAIPAVRLVATFRHPVAVASSLMNRPGLRPANPPVQLWARYNRTLLNLLEHFEIPLVCFDWPADTYVCAVAKMAKYLGLQHGPASSFDYFDNQIRTGVSVESEDATLGDEVGSIYNALLERSDAWR